MTGDHAAPGPGKRAALGWAGRWLLMLPVFAVVGLVVTWVSQLSGHPAGRGMWYSAGLLWLSAGFAGLTKTLMLRWRGKSRRG